MLYIIVSQNIWTLEQSGLEIIKKNNSLVAGDLNDT